MDKIGRGVVIIFIMSVMPLVRSGLIFAQGNIHKEIKYLGANYRDPFLSFIPEQKVEKKIEKVSFPSLNLNGLVWGGSKPQAIINNTVVGKGDKIQGVEVVDIKKDGIVLIYNGEEFFMDRISGKVKAADAPQ